MFSKTNFIADINNDVILKIRNVSGQVVYLIREPTCTVSVKGCIISIKQAAESTTINLEFSSSIEAYDAHIILRDALKILLDNQTISIPPVPTINIFTDKFIGSPYTVGPDIVVDVPFIFNEIISIYVNGVLIDKDWYTYTKIPYKITWYAIADYEIDNTDLISILYV